MAGRPSDIERIGWSQYSENRTSSKSPIQTSKSTGGGVLRN